MYDFVIQTPDGLEVFNVPFTSIQIKEELNKGYDGSLSVSYPDIKKYASAFGLKPDDIFATNNREWYLRKDEVKIFGGIFLNRKISGGSEGMTQYNVSLSDFSGILAKRRTNALFQRLATDSGVIVSDLLDYTNGIDDTTLSMGTQPTLKVRDLTSRFESIRDAIVSMSALKKYDGYDWDCDVVKHLNLYDGKGEERLYIVFDEFNTISFQSNRQLQGKLTNKVIVLGSGYEGDMVTSTRQDSTSQASWGLLEDVSAEKGVGDVDELADRGDQFLQENAYPDDVISIKHRDDTPDITSYNIGDTVRVRFRELSIDDSFRIYKRTIQVDSDGGATVDLSFE